MNEGLLESLLIAQTSQGYDLRATPLRVTRHQVAFEIYSASAVLQVSEVLSNFQILFGGQSVYSGRAVVRSLVNTGLVIVCEAGLEDGWLDSEVVAAVGDPGKLKEQFTRFVADWHKARRIEPEFKVLVADIQQFLTDLREWLDQVELGIRSSPSGQRLVLEQNTVDHLSVLVLPAISHFFEEFERLTRDLPEDVRPVYRAYARRNLHPLILSSPFAYRTFHKPLGYSGDYEMVNMLALKTHQGGSLFAKIINHWFIEQPPAEAHRNRISHLVQVLNQESARLHAARATLRVFNLGCGPAIEVQQFVEKSEASNRAAFTLIDFNEETLQHAQTKIEEIKAKYGRSAEVKVIKRSVQQILKDGGKRVQRSPDQQFDLVYCTGLFDYLSDQVCQRLTSVLYELVSPGGLLVLTNVDGANPSRQTMEHILDWHLIYRTARQVEALRPSQIPADLWRVNADPTSLNIFIEVRKSSNV